MIQTTYTRNRSGSHPLGKTSGAVNARLIPVPKSAIVRKYEARLINAKCTTRRINGTRPYSKSVSLMNELPLSNSIDTIRDLPGIRIKNSNDGGYLVTFTKFG